MLIALAEDDEVKLPRSVVRFPIELRAPDGFHPEDPSSWPHVDGRLEYVGGRLLYMPPCGDIQQDVAPVVTAVLLEWAAGHSDYVVGGNEAGMRLGGETRGADGAVWRCGAIGERLGGYRRVAPVLAAEVAGMDESEIDLRDKARWYLEHGVVVVWLVLPQPREVVVLTAEGERRVCGGETLPEHAALPGLAPRADRFFVQLDR
jgi:Uma2 family endonuclease